MSNCLCSSSFDATQCDLFHNERLCSLDSISDIVGTISGIENEAECQNRCTLDPACNHFMFIAFTNKDSKCFLLVKCTSDSKTCSDLEDCSNVITGPKTPALEEACCNELQDVICENESEIDHSYDITNSTECQTLCQNTIGCRYWSLYGQICFLYNACTTPSTCTLCFSGSAFPDLSICQAVEDGFHTLILGGWTSQDFYSSSVELVTPHRTCTPSMDQLPVSRVRAAATVLGSRVFYCGGYDHQYQKSCYSVELDVEHPVWQEEASMTTERRDFGLTAVGDTLFATGGFYGSALAHSSVEVFTYGEGWRQWLKLEMTTSKYSHCSVALGTWLYTIGGIIHRTGDSFTSDFVETYDTSSTSSTTKWERRASLLQKRHAHGCHADVFEGQEGIYVAGGFDGIGDLSSTEFYNAEMDRWQTLGSLQTARPYSHVTLLGKQIMVGGGGKLDILDSVEIFNGSTWHESSKLGMGRSYHAAVSITAGQFSCQGDQESNHQPRRTVDVTIIVMFLLQALTISN